MENFIFGNTGIPDTSSSDTVGPKPNKTRHTNVFLSESGTF